ncbi:hypothetical protein GMSM_29720 [Geomonas sp. Red276]
MNDAKHNIPAVGTTTIANQIADIEEKLDALKGSTDPTDKVVIVALEEQLQKLKEQDCIESTGSPDHQGLEQKEADQPESKEDDLQLPITDLVASAATVAEVVVQVNTAATQVITLTDDDADDFLDWKANKRNRRITKLSKPYGQDVTSRRNTLVLRRVDCDAIAPDEDVLAYLIIYGLKKPSTPEGKKVQVTEADIKAYLSLDYDFLATPTLEALTEKAKEFGEAGDAGEE